MKHRNVMAAIVIAAVVVAGGCGALQDKEPLGPSVEEVEAVRGHYVTTFHRLEEVVDATDQAGSDAFDCESVACWEDSIATFEEAIQTEQNAWLEFDDAMSRRLTLLDALADAEGDECRSCPNYIGAVHLHVAAERMFQQARDAENKLYLEFLRCDSDACWNRIEDRLDEEAVPRRADAAQRLHDAQQRMLDAEAVFHSEMENSFQ